MALREVQGGAGLTAYSVKWSGTVCVGRFKLFREKIELPLSDGTIHYVEVLVAAEWRQRARRLRAPLMFKR